MSQQENIASQQAFESTLNSGRLDGPVQGHPPTGKSFSVYGLQTSRFEGAKLVERWVGSDQLSLMPQLGLA